MAFGVWRGRQLLVALKNTPHEDKEFSNRASVDLATMLVFFNSLIVVAFYAWILQVTDMA